MNSKTTNQELWDRHLKVMPGGQSNLRGGLMVTPTYMVKGRGSHLWDVEGREYIDYTGAAGPGIFGYSNIEHINAIKKQMDALYFVYSGVFPNPIEVDLGEKFVQHIPCAERVRFCVTGSEAVQLAIRLSRAITKRRIFIRFEGHYHGWPDNVLGGILNDDAGSKPFAIDDDKNDFFATEGRDPDAFLQSFKLPWNDIEILEKVLKKYGEEVAMILMEPINCNAGCCPPRPGYLERVRELCTSYGIVFVLDEVITGFRVALNGAQGQLGITPDIATFGKGMAAGFPVSAVAGKKEILNQLLERKVVGAGTFNGNPLGIAAALSSIRILEKGIYYTRIDEIQKRLMTGIKEISKRRSVPMLVQGPRGVFAVNFIEKEIAYSARDLKDADAEKSAKFRMLLMNEGVLVHVIRWHLCDALTDADIDKTLEAIDRVLPKL